MMPRQHYLDYNATAPLRPEAQKAMQEAQRIIGNPSSVHRAGRDARAVLEKARANIAKTFAAKPQNVVFTSGGTEACNLAFQVAGNKDIKRILISAIEHPAVREAAKAASHAHNIPAHEIPVDENGQVLLDALSKALEEKEPALIAVMAVNNETSVIQPSAEIAKIAQAHGSVLLTDAVQAAGKMRLTLGTMGDMLALSAHKFGGPKGIGALLVRDGLELPAQLVGGGQEQFHRAGTPNVVGVAGFDAALRASEAKREKLWAQLSKWQSQFENGLKRQHNEIEIIGSAVARSPYASCIARAGVSAESLVIALDLAGYAISAGAACSSGKLTPSHVLVAQGFKPNLVQSAIRVSWGWASQKAQLTGLARAYGRAVQKQQRGQEA